MNDAMMLMKSRHNYTKQYLTGHARRAFLLLALLVTAGSAWGQTLVRQGTINSQEDVAIYNELLTECPVEVSSQLGALSTWQTDENSNILFDTRHGQHWNGTEDTYTENNTGWGNTSWSAYTWKVISLPKGKYVLVGPARAAASVTAYMKVGDLSVQIHSGGDKGLGINRDGIPSFNPADTYANNEDATMRGRGWRYSYIQFELTGSTNVEFRVEGGTENASEQWMSFTNPKLYSDNGAFGSGVAYTFQLYNTGKYLNLTDGGAVVTSSPQPLYLVKTSDLNYYITDGSHYLGFSGSTESPSTSTVADNKKSIYIEDMTIYNLAGYFSLSCVENRYVGVDYQDNSTSCIVNRGRSNTDADNYNLWQIAEYVLPPYSGSLLSHTTPQTIEVPVAVSNKYSKNLTELSDDYNAIVTGMSAEGTTLTANMLKIASGFGASATQGGDAGCEYVLNSSTGTPYGDNGVNNYADLSGYAKLVVTVAEGTPRFLFNRDVSEGQWNEDESQSHLIDSSHDGWVTRYFTKEGNVYTVNLQKMKADKGYVHLHAIKSSGGNVTVESMELYGTPLTTADMHRYNNWTDASQGVESTGTYNYILGRSTDQPFGDPAVNAYVDLSAYKKLVVTMSSGTPRFMFNRDTDNGQWNADESNSHLIEYPKDGWINRYFTKEGNTYIVDLEKMVQDKGYAHLHAIKGAYWQNVTMENMALYGSPTGNVYARLFVADKTTGEQMDQGALIITPPSSWTQKIVDDTNYGYVYYGDASGLKAALNNITVSSANPLYQGNATVSLVVSSDFTRMIPPYASSASDINVEPNWEKQYLLDFYKVDEYVGAIKSNGTEIREVVQLADASVTTTQLTKLANAYSQIISKLSNSSGKVYARLFVSDDAGDLLDDQSVFTYSGLPSGWTQIGNYGYVYYGDGFDASLLQGITVSASTPLPSSGAQVGLVVSSDMARLDPSSPGSSTDIDQEPNWEVLYLNHFSYPFAGNMMYKVFSHSKEILLTSSEINSGRSQIPLNEALDRIKSEYVKTNVSTTGSQALADNLHIRWFVTYKGEIIANSEDYLATVATGTAHKTKNGYGIYWNSKISGASNPLNASSNDASTETINWLNMNFTKPDYGDWNDYKVVVWMSDDTSYANGQRPEGSNLEELTHEPNINMVYTYSFFVEDNFRFVHSKGAAVEAYPSLPYLRKGSSVQQYDWDNSTSSIVASTIGDTRQDVHTLTYDVYLQPNSGPQPLKLSFQKYMGNGEVLEPAAYIRWYDWTTDLGTDMLSINNPSGSWLEKYTDSDTGNSRGLFFLNREKQAMYPRHSTVGVNFNTAALASLGENDYYEIACDVSKYYDGLYRSSNDDTRPNFEGLKHPYLLHEPTLSLRYIFRIHPASVIAGKILTGNNKLSSGITSLTSGTGYTNEVKTNMFNDICEDNGRVVVSLNNGVGKYALRANLPSLSDYYINSGNTQCNQITWKAYLEDASGLWERSGEVVSNSSDRIHLFELSNLSGTYNLLSNTSSSKSVTAATGMRFHMVGFVGDGSSEQAAVHYELEFIDAPAILVDDLRELSESGSAEEKAKVKVRRKDYLDTNMIFGGRVSFDEFFSSKTLANQNENHTEKPLPWEDAQYGYCYPQIDNYRIGTNNQSGLTPIHGDYILLKSICGTYSKHWDNNQPYKYFFWRPANQIAFDHVAQEELYDFTKEYGDGSYGGFLYVDAADEARTIASLDFNAHLCTGSQITFTAAIADVTNGDNYPDDASHYRTPPQLMIRVYGVDASGKKTAKPVVSFLTGSLRSVSRKPLHYLDKSNEDYRFMEWYQAYGYTTIPSNSDIQNYTTFIADIDNYCENTDGADYCVDEIRFYTSSGKVNVKMDGGTCVDEDMTFTANIDVEHLENRISLSSTVEKHLYYRIYEKTGESGGQVQYRLYPDNSIYNNGGKSYGDVSIWKYELDGSGNLTSNEHNANYVKVGDDLYFDILDGQTINLEQGKSYFIALTRDLDIAEANLNDPNEWSSPNDACDIYSNFFVPRKKYVHFLTLDDNHEVASQYIIGECGKYERADIEYIIETEYPDDESLTGFRSLPVGNSRNLASVTGVSNPISDDAGENRDQNGVLFDYFVGTEAELKGNYQIGETTYNTSLLAALQHYRNFERVFPQYVSEYSVSLASDYGGWSPANYAILQDAISKGKLLLRASGTFKYEILETTTFLAIPVKKNYVFEGVPYELCNYIPFTFTVNGPIGLPNLALGFDDVDYETAGTKRVIRVGLEQLNKMRTQGYKLHVPINMYKDKRRKMNKRLYFPSDNAYLTLSATNDPTQETGIGTKKFAQIIYFDGTDARPYVDKNHMYLVLDLLDDNCAINFHEGYQYEVATTFHDEDDEGNLANACIGDLFILIKVVPEFVTWESQPVDNDGNTTSSSEYYSANWYNDDNWKRSTRAELYKGPKGESQNTATAAHPNGYDNNGEGSLGSLSGNSGFVPMKFTYVTLPSGNHAPSLINEPRVYGVGKGSRRQGGGFLDLGLTKLKTDRSPRDPDGTDPKTSSNPTENIYYDMLVRYSYSPTDKFGEGCFGHRYVTVEQLNSTDPLTAAEATAFNNAVHPETNKVEGDILTHDEALAYNATTWADDDFDDTQGPQGKVFDCEKFQGNICREIYFKPGAELLRQQRLTYEKAWVEMELDANKWYLLASPLQSTYAGDMYVPTSMTNVADKSTVKGRQVTEAFQPINFDQSKGYSRTLYPIYQRSWGLNNGTVYVKDKDIRANSYSANLKFNTVSTSLVEWGHTFNDVQVPYHTSAQTLDNNLAGFSIRAHKKDQTDKTLIRLPKADTSYDYFDWTNTSSNPTDTGVKIVSKDNYGYEVDGVTLFTVPYSYRLVTDEHSHDGDLEYSISAMQQNGDYVLVGNPYMVSIDMKKFFDTNSTLDQTGYWTYEASAAVANTKPTTVCTDILKPMQGFFVKKGTATEIIFNRDMQIDGNFPPSAPSTGNGARQTTVTLSAANSRGSSSASLEVNEKASAGYVGGEDVETLFDSNLADVPMVYTVAADGQAVSINKLPALEVVPFGVTCSGDEMIDVAVDHSVYVFDALLGTTTAVKEGESVSIQPNDYGRYYLTVSEDASGLLTNKAVVGITISVRDRVVTITSNDDINQVKAVNVSGVTAYESTVGSKTTQFTLATGTYIIDINGVAGSKTVKILVK